MDISSQKTNLFMFPYAGGNKYSYQLYNRKLADTFNVIPLEAPGRGARSKEPLSSDLEELALDLFGQIRGLLDRPYFFFGHSMGSWLAYLVTDLIREHKLLQPEHLFFTGSGNPAHYRPTVIRHKLNKQEFFGHLADLGGLTPEVLNNEALLDYFEPILRADFMAVECYQHKPRKPLTMPITVCIGDDEPNITYSMAKAWDTATLGQFEVFVFKGNHFFILEHSEEISALLVSNWHKYNSRA